MVDKNGNIVSNDSSLVHFNKGKGPAELFGENPVRAKAGIASILVKTNDNTGEVVISTSSEMVNSGELILL